MPTGFDHIVIAVENLDDTIRDYTAAGFTVTPGGVHTGGITHNALVAFADGSYFELIAWLQPNPDQAWYQRLQLGEGLIDFALRADNLEQEVTRLRAAGLNAPDPTDGGRERPDGQRVEWQTIKFGPEFSSALPFYCHSTNDRSLRVPSGDAAKHANGVTGVSGISVLVNDLDAVAIDYARLTGVSGYEDEAAVAPEEQGHRFPIGTNGNWVELVAADDPDSIAAAALLARGELPYEVSLILALDSDTEEQLLPLDLTHGARLLLVKA